MIVSTLAITTNIMELNGIGNFTILKVVQTSHYQACVHIFCVLENTVFIYVSYANYLDLIQDIKLLGFNWFSFYIAKMWWIIQI